MEFWSHWVEFASTGAKLVLLVGMATFFIVQLRERGATGATRPYLKSTVTNLTLLLSNIAILAVLRVTANDVSALVAWAGVPMVPASTFDGVHPVLTVLAVMLGYDFCDYWTHRLSHREGLWGVHAVHHSDKDVNWTTSARVHVLEPVLMWTTYALVLCWISFPGWAVVIGGALSVWHGRYVHMKLGWDHGPVEKIFASPNFHRWHHADVPEAYGKNLGNFFSFWDVMFGTYYNPRKCDAPMGAGDLPDDLWGSIAYPFRYWAGMIRGDLDRMRRKSPPDEVGLPDALPRAQ